MGWVVAPAWSHVNWAPRGPRGEPRQGRLRSVAHSYRGHCLWPEPLQAGAFRVIPEGCACQGWRAGPLEVKPA